MSHYPIFSDEAAWFERLLAALEGSGPTGAASAAYVRRRGVRFAFTRQRATGASWFDWRTLRRGIFVNARCRGRRPEEPAMYAMVAHEAKHLEQGMREALSVRGELAAWQWGFDVLLESGVGPTGAHWKEIHGLDPASRAGLRRARALMKAAGGPGYKIDWLPLVGGAPWEKVTGCRGKRPRTVEKRHCTTGR